MKNSFLIVVFFFSLKCMNAQVVNPYAAIPIQRDTAIQWAAVCDKVINLTPKAGEVSLKKWYLEKLKNSSVTAWKSYNGYLSSHKLSIPELTTQDWLKGLAIELSPTRFPQEWYFYDPAMPKEDYNRYKARAGKLNLAADSCCGCDVADAFRAKQIISYKNGKFTIYTQFISPLCARQTPSPPADWYPLCNVAYNDNPERKFPGVSKDVVLLNTNELDYNFNSEDPSLYDSVRTEYRTEIGNLIYQDILLGRFKAINVETGKSIPVKDLLTMGMPVDTVMVMDPDDPEKALTYRVVQKQMNPRDFNRIRIKQELYFDFKNERLYAVVKGIMLMKVFYAADGKTMRGTSPFCRLE